MSGSVVFKSKIGLLAATVGSAVGLGNIWRFPAETQANGGAAFLLIYAMCVIVLGIPVMLGEFAIGRAGGSDPITNYRRLSPGKKWWLTGTTGIIASYMILCFYTVVAGWVLEYLTQSVTGELYSTVSSTAADADTAAMFTSKMGDNISSTWSPLINTLILIVATFGIIVAGVQKGIERVSNIMMPLLFVILLVFCVVSLTLPNAGAGVEYFLKPDFSKVTMSTIVNAMGQAFFSLSLGMGVLMTYAAYFPKETRLGRTASTVSFFDMAVAVMMGLIVFPAIMSFGLQGEEFEGASLVFVTMPEIFAQMPGSQIWSSLFFMLLLLAALTSVISVAEVTVRMFQDRCNMSRLKAALCVIVPLFFISPLCSLANGPLADFKILGMDLFTLFDTVASNVLLPTGALLMCIYIGWGAPKNLLREQLTNYGSFHSRIVRPTQFLIKWVATPLIAIILVSQFI